MKDWAPSNFEHPGTKVEDEGTDDKTPTGLSVKQYSAISQTSYKNAFMTYLRAGSIHKVGPTDYKAILEGEDAQGGFLVPEQVQTELLQKRQGLTPIMSKVTRYTTGRDSLSIPRNNYVTDNFFTSPVRLQQTGEVPTTATYAKSNDPTFGLMRIEVFTNIGYLNVSRDMIEDSMFPITSFVAEKFAQAQAQQLEGWLINGTGVGQPQGLTLGPGLTIAGNLQPSAVTVSLGTSGQISYAGLNNIFYSIPEQYDDQVVWIFNKTNTARGIHAIVDLQGRPLFGLGYQDAGMAGAPPKVLMGSPYYYSNQVANGWNAAGTAGATGNYPIIFGDLTGYVMVERTALSLQVLDQTAATQNQIQIVGRYRVGGATAEPWKISIGSI
jgi:HK97 family phage major capsid protein